MTLQDLTTGSMLRFYFIFLLLAESAIAAPLYNGQRKSFWLGKPKIMKRIKDDRYIVTTVLDKKKHLFGSKRRIELKGAGLTNAPVDYSFTQAQDFERMGIRSSYVRGVKYDALGSRVDIKAISYGYKITTALKVAIDRNKREISWEVIEGVLVGMTGVLVFEKYADQKTLISLYAEYEYKKLSIPRFFVSFGLEVALKQFASDMRTLIEQDYQKYVNN